MDAFDCLNGECDHFVVEMTGQEGLASVDVCALRCKRIKKKAIQLQRFCVLKDYRESGVGRFALQQIEDYYWKKGIEVIILDAKFHVSGFYEKCGYMVVSEPFMEAGVTHVTMEKRRTF